MQVAGETCLRAYRLANDAIPETIPYFHSNAVETENQRMLDVGCGLGFLCVKLAGWENAEVVGIDPSTEAVELAKKEHARQARSYKRRVS